MKSSELNKLMKKLTLPDKFEKKGRLAYYTLAHKTGAMVLVGFYLDNSIDPNSFFVNYFAQCLYVPFSTYSFSLGNRVGSYRDISRMSELQGRLNEFDVFDKLISFDDFLFFLKKHPYYGARSNRDECFALTYYLLEDYRKSAHFLDKIISLGKRSDSNLFSHQIENARLLKDYIEKGEYDKGISQILQWQEQTIKGIGLKIK